MTNTFKFGIGLTTSLLLLTACGPKVDPEGIAEASDEIQEAQSGVIAIDKELNEYEKSLNDQFNELVTQNEDLASVNDESAKVIENLDERESKLSELTEQEETIRTKAEYIGEYEGTDLPADVIQQLSDDFLTFADNIVGYQEDYQESIDLERNYFKEIASDEADYEDFIDGLEEVNSNYSDLQETKSTFDEEVIQINEKLTEIKELTKEEDPDSNSKENSEEVDNEEDTLNEDTEDSDPEVAEEDSEETDTQFITMNTEDLLQFPKKFPKKFLYDSGVDIDYPEEGVKGIYTTAYSAGGDRMESLVDLINTTDLNSMVIDIKDDHGNITLDLDSDNELVNEMTNEIIDAEELMDTLKENDIYPIARIVVFKDSLLAESKPEWSFTESNGEPWSNNRGESFVNPYLEEVWDYNIEVAIQAAKLGFKDIQFDYVRFAEGFENRADSLNYSHGSYADDSEDVINMEYRNRAVTEFVRKSKESLMPYGADLSIDLFGYAAVVRETPGIGQSFPGISKEVDAVSSMIYPSHWGLGNLDVSKPDLEPYKVVDNYMKIEQEIFDELGEDAPISRPWIQDFTASYLGAGNYMRYGAKEVTAQVEALADNGVHEFLIWNAGNSYSEGATYDFQ